MEEVGPNRWCIPLKHIHDLSLEQFSILGIPIPTPLQVSVRAQGIPGRSPIKLIVEVYDPPRGRLEGVVKRIGPFYFPPDGSPPILVSNSLFSLFRLAEESREECDVQTDFAFLGEVRKLGRKLGSRMEGILEREEYHFPEKVQLEVEEVDPEHLELKPKLEGEELPDVSSERLLEQPNRRVHSIQKDGGRRQRVILSEDVRAGIRGIAQKRSIAGEDVPRFIENPDSFLPVGIDLEDFSNRVKGLKTVVYNSRPYLHLNQKGVGWFEGIPGVKLESIVDDGADSSSTQPSLSTEEFERLVQEAEKSGREYVRIGDGWVKIDSERSRRFLDTVSRLQPDSSGRILLPTQGVLDIYENLEGLEFELPPLEDLGLQIEWDALPDVPVSASFKGELKPFQLIGYRWMANLDQKGTGGLLADEMGLCKTVQVIAHMLRLAEQDRLSPSLVVAPKTILENWAREISPFCTILQ